MKLAVTKYTASGNTATLYNPPCPPWHTSYVEVDLLYSAPVKVDNSNPTIKRENTSNMTDLPPIDSGNAHYLSPIWRKPNERIKSPDVDNPIRKNSLRPKTSRNDSNYASRSTYVSSTNLIDGHCIPARDTDSNIRMSDDCTDSSLLSIHNTIDSSRTDSDSDDSWSTPVHRRMGSRDVPSYNPR